MSWDLLKLVLECEGMLEPAEDHLLLYIANRVNENKGNVAWCTQDYLSKKSGLHISTIKRRCNRLKEKGILSWVKKKREKGKFKRNHYTINPGSLRAMVRQKEVSERNTHIAQNDTQVGITMSYNNLTNKLTNNLDTSLKEKENNLSGPQVAMAKNLADKYFKIYSKEHYGWKQLYKAILNFFLSKQTEDDWLKGGLGLPSPREKGWLKGTS